MKRRPFGSTKGSKAGMPVCLRVHNGNKIVILEDAPAQYAAL